MTTFRVNLAMSLDGFIADSEGGVEWLDLFDPNEFGFEEFLAGIEAIACGAATYEQILGFGVEWPYGDIPFHVLASRPLAPALVSSVQVHRSNFDQFHRDLENRYDGDIWILGGGRLMRSFLEGDSHLRMEIHIIPILLGRGIGPFDGYRSPVPLRTIDATPLNHGVVRLEFERGSAAPVDACCP